MSVFLLSHWGRQQILTLSLPLRGASSGERKTAKRAFASMLSKNNNECMDDKTLKNSITIILITKNAEQCRKQNRLENQYFAPPM